MGTTMGEGRAPSPQPSFPREARVSTILTPARPTKEVVDTRPAARHDGEAVINASAHPATAATLLAWLSPAFPVGGYAYSHGLEQAVEDGDVSDEASLMSWLRDVTALGFARNDAILLRAAHRAASAGDADALADANDLALAFAPTRELHLETSQQGRSFLDAVLAAWPNERLGDVARALPGEVAYPVAVGAAAAAHGLPARDTASAFLVAIAQALVSAAVRLAPIGQTAGARVVAASSPLAWSVALETEALTLDDLASATFRLDLGSARHETQHTRLFRS
jgi:urease accessory protein